MAIFLTLLPFPLFAQEVFDLAKRNYPVLYGRKPAFSGKRLYIHDRFDSKTKVYIHDRFDSKTKVYDSE